MKGKLHQGKGEEEALQDGIFWQTGEKKKLFFPNSEGLSFFSGLLFVRPVVMRHKTTTRKGSFSLRDVHPTRGRSRLRAAAAAMR